MTPQPWTSTRTHDRVASRIDSRLYSLFLFRHMLQLKGITYTHGPQVSIMTYNVLYLIGKKKTYSFEGLDSHRLRERVILSEIGRYNPDILCLQEVPVGENCEWWEKRLFELGYELTFVYVGMQDHGIAVCFKYDLFTEICNDYSNLDGCMDELGANRAVLFLCLGYKEKFLRGHTKPSRQGLIIGNTHLGSTRAIRHEKMEQMWFLSEAARRFEDFLREKTKSDYRFYKFLAGDFNTRDFDPVFYPLDLPFPLREQYERTPSKISYTEFLKERNYTESLYKRAFNNLASLYSLAYHHVEKEANIAQLWAFIDHIFVVSDSDQDTTIDKVLRLPQFGDVKLLALLRVPTKLELGKSRLSQPAVGVCPSDHVCLMADIELL